LDEFFRRLDSDGDGSLTMLEIRTNIDNIGVELTPKEVSDLIDRLDENTDGVVTKEEFLKLLSP
jgi:calcium-binding protein CML